METMSIKLSNETLNTIRELTEDNCHTLALQRIAEYFSVRNPRYWFFANEFDAIEKRSVESLSRLDNEYRYNLKEAMMTKIEMEYGKEVKNEITKALS